MKESSNRIFLIGYMGSGKSTIAKLLGKMTGIPYLDMDQEIEKASGMSIRQIFIKYGEHEFRNRESALLDKLCHVNGLADVLAGAYEASAESPESLIVSCGGGIILDDANRKILNQQYTIFLEASSEILFDRVNGDTNRPFAFMDIADESERRQKFLDLYKKREPLYKEAAHIIIQTDGKSPDEIAEEILSKILSNDLLYPIR